MSETRPLQPHWSIMKEYDVDMYAKCTQWRDAITYNEVLPLKTKEIMMVCMCCLIRFHEGLKVHVKYALQEGVTKEELFAAATTSMLLGGIPAYRDGIAIIIQVLEEERVA